MAADHLTDATALRALSDETAACRRCPRLVEWRESVAQDPPARFRGQDYWARPVPGWGDAAARILLVGLAPAAHGANRTGRLFTGDRSGDFLFAALHRAGLVNQPTSTSRGDELGARGVYISAAVRCAPPDNKPLPDELTRCLPYLVREIALLPKLRVVVALGGYAWTAVLRALGETRSPRPRFGHLAETHPAGIAMVGSYHPSQQNTFTGRLTPEMLDEVLDRARAIASAVD